MICALPAIKAVEKTTHILTDQDMCRAKREFSNFCEFDREKHQFLGVKKAEKRNMADCPNTSDRDPYLVTHPNRDAGSNHNPGS